MEYTYQPEEYAKQLAEYYELEKLSFSPEDGREHIIAKLEERSVKKRVIADTANTMIREYIETFEKDPEAVTAEDAEKLDSFIRAMQTGQGLNSRCPDPAIMLRAQRIRKDYYEKNGDLEETVGCINNCNHYYLQLFAMHSSTFSGTPYREEALSLKDRFTELSAYRRAQFMTVVARMTAVQMRGFDSGDFSMDRVWEACSLQEELAEADRAFPPAGDPDPRAEASGVPPYYADMLLQNCEIQAVNTFCDYCVHEKDRGRIPDIGSMRPKISHILDRLRSDVENGRNLVGIPIHMELLLAMADLHLGNITKEEFFEKCDQFRHDALALDPRLQLIILSDVDNTYLTYLYKYSGLEPEKINSLCRARLDESLPRLLQTAKLANDIHFNAIPMKYVTCASYISRFSDFAGTVLDLSVYSDKALFIHTAMVREMSRAIFDHLIDEDPGFFTGVAGRDAEYIRDHKEEMRALLDDCCMYHDLGKFWMTDITDNSMRRLTDEEFSLIKEHPLRFDDVYARTDRSDERFMCIRDCALTHHLWHDGTRGYPAVPQTKNRPFADIIAIADGMDAATDFLGRPYNSGKNVDQLTEEFRAGSGTRYGPEAVAALSDRKVRDRLDYLINEGRKEIYYRIYAFNELPDII
jgi:HD-GYP domain-containing protein (c-di-GMP phosphodiesterase class II)